jgi:hypothetical protein
MQSGDAEHGVSDDYHAPPRFINRDGLLTDEHGIYGYRDRVSRKTSRLDQVE